MSTLTTISRSAAALCAAGLLSLGFAATASAEPDADNPNTEEYWEAFLADEGFVNPVCTKDETSLTESTWTSDGDYLIVVLKAGSGEDENTVYGIDENDDFVGVEEGEELETNDGKDISHIITCDADKESETPKPTPTTSTPKPSTPGKPIGPIVETDIVESGVGTTSVALGGAALLAGVGASVLVLRRKGQH